MKTFNLFCLCFFVQLSVQAQVPNIDLTKVEGTNYINNQTLWWEDVGTDIRTTDNYIFVTGTTYGKIDSLNVGSLNIKPDDDTLKTFLYKYDLQGNKIFGFTIKNTRNGKVVPTTNGGCYLFLKPEQYSNLVDLNPLPNSSTVFNAHPDDRLIGKYNAMGLLEWAFKIEGHPNTSSLPYYLHDFDMEIDASNNLYFYGSFTDSIALDPNNPSQKHYTNYPYVTNSFVAKYNPLGQLVWSFDLDSVGQYNSDIANSLDVNDNNEIIIYGRLAGNTDIDPDTNTVIMNTQNGLHFVARYDNNGNLINGFNFGDNYQPTFSIFSYHNTAWMETDSASNIYLGFRGLGGDLDPSAGQYYLPAANWQKDYTLVSYTKNGQLRWANRLSLQATGGHNYVFGAAVNAQGNLVIAHRINRPVDYDPGFNTVIHKPKVSPFNPSTYTEHTVISEYNKNGYYSGSFDPMDTSNNSNYYTILDLEIDNDCNIYTTGAMSNNLVSGPLNSFILNSSTGPLTYPLFDTIGSDIVTVKYSDNNHINPIVQNDTNSLKICSGDSLVINMSGLGEINWYNTAVGGNLMHTGITLNTPPLYLDTTFYVEDVRCNIVSGRTKVEVSVIPINNSISPSLDTLWSNQSGATYQWVDCNTNLPLPNETNQYITGKIGTYAVEITIGNCTRRSPCVNLWPNAISSFSDDHSIKIYPNPSSNEITIEIKGKQKINTYYILDPTGKRILSGESSSSKITLDVSSLANGIYYLRIENRGTYKFVKE